MKNWSKEEKESMKGCVIHAITLYNSICRGEYGVEAVPDHTLNEILKYVDRATEDLTEIEARDVYLKSDFD